MNNFKEIENRLNLFTNICKAGCKIIIRTSDQTYYCLTETIPDSLIKISETLRHNTIIEFRALNSSIVFFMKRYRYDDTYFIGDGVDFIRYGAVFYETPSHVDFIHNQKKIDNMVHYLYSRTDQPNTPNCSKSEYKNIFLNENPALIDFDLHKKIIWDIMYEFCFKKIGIYYLIICDIYLVSDIRKILINNILRLDKWSNVGFICSF